MIRVSAWALVQAAFFLFPVSAVSPVSPVAPVSADGAAARALPLDTIVARMEQHTAEQRHELETYEATRHYRVQYKGFGTSLAGELAVQVHFDQANGKTFQIVSQSGSKLLCDKVLKKAVESEAEAAKDPSSTALTPANYKFELAGTDVLNGRAAYVLHVDPLRAGKFLYRGKVWVDAADFAVAKIEVEPAKNPSFWISRSDIENTYERTDGVWLPERNRSESKIRVGGTAVLTIDYGTYRVVVAGEPATGAGGAGGGVKGAGF